MLRSYRFMGQEATTPFERQVANGRAEGVSNRRAQCCRNFVGNMWPPAHCFAVLLLGRSGRDPASAHCARSPPTEMRRASALSLIGCGQSICMRPFGRPHPVICITLSADGEVHRKAGWASANSTPAEALCGRSCLGRQQLWACPGHNPMTIPGLPRRPQIDRGRLRTKRLRQLDDIDGEAGPRRG